MLSKMKTHRLIHLISQGMSFIHNKTNIGSHGNLKTTNILVSDNFAMKISDYGECVFMSDMKKMYHHSEVEYNKRKDEVACIGFSCYTDHDHIHFS